MALFAALFSMLYVLLLLFFPLSLTGFLYKLPIEPIDVVIPCCEKDLLTLDLCIDGIQKNGSFIRNIFVISSKPLTNQATWIDESLFPFTKEEVALALCKGNKELAHHFLQFPSCRLGWYYQQLLKFYAPFVIEGISSNVLILDADTIFLNPTKFLNEHYEALYASSNSFYTPYSQHMAKFLPGLSRIHPKQSGICHHMLFQRPILEDLFSKVESYHQIPLWKAFCLFVDPKYLSKSGASEYEIYFHFAFSQTEQLHVRPLKWKNIQHLSQLTALQSQGYHYASCHDYLRKLPKPLVK